MRILSIDAWREDFGWTWNNWFTVDEISLETFQSLDTNRKVISFLRNELNLLSESSKGRVRIVDDNYNLMIEDRSNGRPLYAIEYGAELISA